MSVCDYAVPLMTVVQVANEGAAAFYTGSIAQGMVDATQAAGGT
jgi:gamma-glutamyltranspeptidase